MDFDPVLPLPGRARKNGTTAGLHLVGVDGPLRVRGLAARLAINDHAGLDRIEDPDQGRKPCSHGLAWTETCVRAQKSPALCAGLFRVGGGVVVSAGVNECRGRLPRCPVAVVRERAGLFLSWKPTETSLLFLRRSQDDPVEEAGEPRDVRVRVGGGGPGAGDVILKDRP